MYTLFSEVLPKNDWLALFDNIIFNHPSFFLYCVAGYVISARGPLLSMKSLEDFQFFFHHRNSIQASQIVDNAKKLMKRTPKSKKRGTQRAQNKFDFKIWIYADSSKNSSL